MLEEECSIVTLNKPKGRNGLPNSTEKNENGCNKVQQTEIFQKE